VKLVGVIDASCVIALDELSLLPSLSWLFENLHIPRAVRAELYRRTATKKRIRTLLREYDFVRRCNDYDQNAVNVLLIDHVLGSKDRGEAEAVVQATKIGAFVIVDDPWGRKLAEHYSLKYGGTLWVLGRLTELELMTPAGLRKNILRLLEVGSRFPQEGVNKLLQRFREQEV